MMYRHYILLKLTCQIQNQKLIDYTGSFYTFCVNVGGVTLLFEVITGICYIHMNAVGSKCKKKLPSPLVTR